MTFYSPLCSTFSLIHTNTTDMKLCVNERRILTRLLERFPELRPPESARRPFTAMWSVLWNRGRERPAVVTPGTATVATTPRECWEAEGGRRSPRRRKDMDLRNPEGAGMRVVESPAARGRNKSALILNELKQKKI